MELEKLKETEVWKEYSNNPRFEIEINKAIRKCCYYVDLENIKFKVLDKKIIISCNSDIKNRDLDSQFKIYRSFEISHDDDNNLVVHEQSARLESNYGYDFTNTTGGKLNTEYASVVYDPDGIELAYQSYGDKYILNQEMFKSYNEDLESVVNNAYNPKLIDLANKTGVYPHPRIIGEDSRFLRQIRSKDNLGIIEVSKCRFGKDERVTNQKKEYYFNTFFGSRSSESPELMHFVHGFPFAVIDENHEMRVQDDYVKLGLTDKNFHNVAKERFLKELQDEKNQQVDKDILSKYDMLISKVKVETIDKGTTR